MSLIIFIIAFIFVNIKACPDHCEICNEENICTSYKNGYYLINGKCEKCSSNCKRCETTANHCLNCYSGYYLNSNKCEKCPDICQGCMNENKCTSCIDNYYLNNYQCLQCSSTCRTCSQQDLCTECNTNYYRIENAFLNNEQNFNCHKEPEGYYLDNDIYKECY